MTEAQNTVSIKFLGAAGTVTGSKHLLKTPELNILVDCGLFQGLKSLRLKNWQPFSIDPASVDLVILTHGHLDHCGYLPLFIKNGFKGKVYCSEPTREVASLILKDSAKIQEEDAEEANRLHYSKHEPALPLYTIEDAEKAIDRLVIVEENRWRKISENIEFRLIRNGHILGSCFIELKCYGKTIVFSGDIGRYNSRYLQPPSIIHYADFLVMESTYGNRLHPEGTGDESLRDVINTTLNNHGNILIPSFAVGRAQELLLMINELKENRQIPDVPVYLDSPMALHATRMLERYPGWHSVDHPDMKRLMGNVEFIEEAKNTRKVIESRGSKIVIAASGMLTGGRVLEYLKYYMPDKKNTVVIAGYQSEGTRGRALLDGASEIKIHGGYFPVRARIAEITSLSAHADQQEMLSWLRMFSETPKMIFLVHGEPAALDGFRVKLNTDLHIEPQVPSEGQELLLFNIS